MRDASILTVSVFLNQRSMGTILTWHLGSKIGGNDNIVCREDFFTTANI